MGLFFEPLHRPDLKSVVELELNKAFRTDPNAINPDVEAAARSNAVSNVAATGVTFKTTNFLAALGILALFVVGAVVADGVDLDDSSRTLYGFATTTLGIIVGLLGGEKSSS